RHDVDRERRSDRSAAARHTRSRGGARRRPGPRHLHLGEATFHPIRSSASRKSAAHSCVAPAGSDVRTAAQRPALSETRCLFRVEMKRVRLAAAVSDVNYGMSEAHEIRDRSERNKVIGEVLAYLV